jgi:hypothetical protein
VAEESGTNPAETEDPVEPADALPVAGDSATGDPAGVGVFVVGEESGAENPVWRDAEDPSWRAPGDAEDPRRPLVTVGEGASASEQVQ